MRGFVAVAFIPVNSTTPTLAPPAPVVETLFPDLDPGDVRRNRRFARVVEALGRAAGASLPEFLSKPADSAACLRFFDL